VDFLKETDDFDFEWVGSLRALTLSDMLSILLSPWKEDIDGDRQN
jgi:hypothetical protein